MTSFPTLSLEPSSTVDRVAEELRRALFDGEVTPGTPLREVALAESMGVARSTIREALGILVAEGVATRAPNRGVRVTELDPQAVHDVCTARAVLETAGVRRWASAPEADREACRAALRDFAVVARDAVTDGAGPPRRPGSAADLTAAHLNLHLAFVALTGSARLVTLAESLSAEIRLALARVDRIRRNAGDQVHAHQDLVDLLDRGEVDRAVAELEGHLEGAERSMLIALDLPRPVRLDR